jgi:hypothetical protein
MSGTDIWEEQAPFAMFTPTEAFIFCETGNSCRNIYKASGHQGIPFPSTWTMTVEFVLEFVKSERNPDKRKFGWEEA